MVYEKKILELLESVNNQVSVSNPAIRSRAFSFNCISHSEVKVSHKAAQLFYQII